MFSLSGKESEKEREGGEKEKEEEGGGRRTGDLRRGKVGEFWGKCEKPGRREEGPRIIPRVREDTANVSFVWEKRNQKVVKCVRRQKKKGGKGRRGTGTYRTMCTFKSARKSKKNNECSDRLDGG